MKASKLLTLDIVCIALLVLIFAWHTGRRPAHRGPTEDPLVHLPIRNALPQLARGISSNITPSVSSSKFLNPGPLLARSREAHEQIQRSERDPLAARQQISEQLLARVRSLASNPSNRNIPPMQGAEGGREESVLNPQQQRALDELRSILGPEAQVRMDRAEGTLRYLEGDLIKFVEGQPDFSQARQAGDSVAMSVATLNALGRVMNVRDPATEFVAQPASHDELGMTHVKFDQQWNGLPVYGAQVVVHFNRENEPMQVNGGYVATPGILPGADNGINAEQALALAVNKVGAYGPGLLDPEVSKVVYWYPHQVLPVVAYKVELVPSLSKAWRVFVSAADGAVIQVLSTVQSAADVGSSPDLNGVTRTVNCWKDGTTYYACDTSQPMYDAARSQPINLQNIYGGICVLDVGQQDFQVALTNGTLVWVKTANKNNWDPTAVTMINNLGTTYNYYRTVHGQNSVDNAGCSLTSLIHARFDFGGPQLTSDNAIYNPNFNILVFGDGDTAFIQLPKALDVTAHELTHSVSGHLVNLTYQNQSGALSENLSDFIGCMVDRDEWVAGDGIIRDPAFIGLRDMSDPQNPQVMSRQPKTMAQYQNLPATQDQGGVHINSGIPNYATYLMTDGPGGMGRDKAERVVYRAMRQGYLTMNSQFVDYRRGLIRAAKDLFGDGAEAAAIRQSFDTVGITDGQETPPPTPGTPTSGSEFALFLNSEYDPFFGMYLGEALYQLSSANFSLVASRYVTETRPAISGDGTWALYIGQDHNVYRTDGVTEQQWTTSGDVRTIAMSKDGRFITFTTTDYDNTIGVLDTTTGQFRTAVLEVPTDAEGIVSSLLFADILTFNFTGDSLFFDALSGGGSGNTAFTCWGTYVLRIKDLSVLPVFAASPSLQVGNPSLANTLGYQFVADYITTQSGQTNIGVVSVDVLHANIGQLGSGLNVLAESSFRGDDSKIVYRIYSSGLYYLSEATLSADKLSLVAGSVSNLLWASTPLSYPVGFRSGTYTPCVGKCDVLGAGNPADLRVDFGTALVNSSVSRTVIITNAGNADLNLIQIHVEGADTTCFAHNGINQTLPPGHALPVTITLTPNREGSLCAALRIKSSAPGEGDVVIALTGTGLSATHDSDGDGVPDWQEVVAGTNPTNSASVLMLHARLASPGPAVALNWLSATGRTYCVEFRPDLATGWQTLTSNIPGCGTPLEVLDFSLSPSTRYYRLRVTRD